MTDALSLRPPGPDWQRRWPRAALRRLFQHPIAWTALVGFPFMISWLAGFLLKGAGLQAAAVLVLIALAGFWLHVAVWLAVRLDGERPAVSLFKLAALRSNWTGSLLLLCVLAAPFGVLAISPQATTWFGYFLAWGSPVVIGAAPYFIVSLQFGLVLTVALAASSVETILLSMKLIHLLGRKVILTWFALPACLAIVLPFALPSRFAYLLVAVGLLYLVLLTWEIVRETVLGRDEREREGLGRAKPKARAAATAVS